MTGGTVPPGGTADVSINLTAPNTEGTYKGLFKLKAGDGAIFGIGAAANGSFFVQIKAVAPAEVIVTKTSTESTRKPVMKVTRNPLIEITLRPFE